MAVDLEQIAPRLRIWRNEPETFVRELFKPEPLEWWQVEALRAFPKQDKQRLALKAAKGCGKSAVEAWCIWNFMTCYGAPGSHPKGAATSITQPNLRDNLWAELAKWHGRSELLTALFDWSQTKLSLREHPETWFFSARTWSKSADKQRQADTLAGLHADYVLFVLDESGGIPESVMAAAEGGLATGKWCKILQGGNPTHNEGPLYRACTKERSLWDVIEVTGDPDNPRRSNRIREKWAREQIFKYGRDNPWVLVNVFGEFPPHSINALLGPDDVSKAMERELPEEAFSWAQKRLGIDVARFGDDRTVLFPRQGLVAFRPDPMRNADTVDITARAAAAMARWEGEIAYVDDTGHWGHGVYDNLRRSYPCTPVIFSNPAHERQYANIRTQIWWRMAEWVKAGGCLPELDELTEELTVPTYTYHKGAIMLEDKDDIKDRLGRSPDLADALALTFYDIDIPKSHRIRRGRVRVPTQLATDYDHLAQQ